MCIAQPKIPNAPAPVLDPPAQQKKLELNPALTKTKQSKKLGTRKLQIPLGGTGSGGSGINIPTGS